MKLSVYEILFDMNNKQFLWFLSKNLKGIELEKAYEFEFIVNHVSFAFYLL